MNADVGDVRPTWDDVWMSIAHIISMRSVDPAYKTGCVIVTGDNRHVVSVGYNAMEMGGPNNVDSLERGQSGTVHAEINALIKANTTLPHKLIMYVTMSPCKICARAIVNAGIDEVVYQDEYRDSTGIEILRLRGVQVRKFTRRACLSR